MIAGKSEEDKIAQLRQLYPDVNNKRSENNKVIIVIIINLLLVLLLLITIIRICK